MTDAKRSIDMVETFKNEGVKTMVSVGDGGVTIVVNPDRPESHLVDLLWSDWDSVMDIVAAYARAKLAAGDPRCAPPPGKMSAAE